ncbi:formate dehydrogenase region TAT target [Meinhardsimonia xiamenensis]|jgi:anaerobic selenocysteine-containing dehydrogenase|uniref:Formate dehydrogenase region TAT target n=1 Tax=Meinhardsimonia xiamenensis TaxID=990712 RepID=A0A1G9F4N0_9RHOB|nr:twin-arginine translocation signal domain-containing protein [Meinhardsimonia xiamenensis]PRX37999.1 secreted protein [Meinhardsimonia xiamenensis]SDK83300.1 formate dehydrogenase region TAT target [Meinhardsimonia xiamenensis]
MEERKAGASRRDFLKLAGTGAPAAVAAAALAPVSAEAEEATGSMLRETEHVRKYLESARF